MATESAPAFSVNMAFSAGTTGQPSNSTRALSLRSTVGLHAQGLQGLCHAMAQTGQEVQPQPPPLVRRIEVAYTVRGLQHHSCMRVTCSLTCDIVELSKQDNASSERNVEGQRCTITHR